MKKYLLYAVGEIVLVIIGILIALAISEWNGNRKIAATEHQLLQELSTGLKSDLGKIEDELEDAESAIKRISTLQDYLSQEELPLELSGQDLESMFGTVYGIRNLRLNSAFYEDIKSRGLNLISDDALRLAVVDLFENHYALMNKIFENESIVNEVLKPYYLTHFHDIDFKTSAKANTIDQVWNDTYYHNIVDYRRITLEGNQIDAYKDAIVAIKNVVRLIELD